MLDQTTPAWRFHGPLIKNFNYQARGCGHGEDRETGDARATQEKREPLTVALGWAPGQSRTPLPGHIQDGGASGVQAPQSTSPVTVHLREEVLRWETGPRSGGAGWTLATFPCMGQPVTRITFCIPTP